MPWGVVRERSDGPALPAVRLGGDAVVLARAGIAGDDPAIRRALDAPDLNALIELGPAVWRELRARLTGGAVRSEAWVPLTACEALLPIRVTDYADFYASLEHATNFGRIFRRGATPVSENWHHIPLAYHGRASTVIVSGTPVRRPHGPVGPGALARTGQLDLECELGYVCGPSAGGPIPIDRAEQHIFGVVLVNDWSARDVQRFEYEPLGPFLGKSFATSMSAWITPLDVLGPARVAPREQEPQPASYLRARQPWLLDVALEIEINGEVVSRPAASELYWTPAQMLAHLTVNGARLSAGDLFATGTVSNFGHGRQGSVAELFAGKRWLSDGDEVVLRGRAGDVQLGEVRGRIVAG